MPRTSLSHRLTAASMALLPTPYFLLPIAYCLLLALPGCGSSNPAPSAETKKFLPADAAANQNQPASGAASNSDPLVVNNEFATSGRSSRDASPPGPQTVQVTSDVKSVLEQMDRLASQPPKAKTPQEQLEEFVQIQTQRLALGKKALTMNPPIEVKRMLVVQMYEILQRFTEIRITSGMSQLVEFAKNMSADPDPEVARIGRHAQFSATLTRLVGDQNNAGGVNTKEIIAEAKKLLAFEKGNISQDTLTLVGQTADMLTQGGFDGDAADLIETIAGALKDDPKLSEQAPRYALVAKVVKMDLATLMDSIFKEEPGSAEKAEAALKTLLTDIPPSRDLLNQAQTIAHILEATGHYKSALAAYDQIAQSFASSSDESLARQVKDMAPAAKLRIGLVGQPFTVEGVTIDGTPLDWSAFAGKVTLVDFWATWCGPCLEEMPNVRLNFEQFHSKGFEVIGVSMDAKASDLKQFLTLQGSEIPWVTVTSQVVLDNKLTDGDWSKLPMAAKCGVQSIPFIVLVGRDGKVDSIHVRGAKLKKRLGELLGEPASAEIPSDPTLQTNPPAIPSTSRRTDGKQSRRGVGVSPALTNLFPGPSLGTHYPESPASLPFYAAAKWLPLPLGEGWGEGLTTAGLIFISAALTAPEDPSPEPTASTNPYLAKPDLSSKDLIAFIQKMLDRPQAIQARDGFSAGIIDACDRILAAQPTAADSDQLLAVQTKLAVLHRDACDDKKGANDQLNTFVDQLQDDSRPAIAKEVVFLRLERRVLTAKEAPVSEVPPVLDSVKEFAAHEKLSAKHLRLASSTVALINRIESETERESRFAELGELFAQSPDKDLSRYGRKIAKSSATK